MLESHEPWPDETAWLHGPLQALAFIRCSAGLRQAAWATGLSAVCLCQGFTREALRILCNYALARACATLYLPPLGPGADLKEAAAKEIPWSSQTWETLLTCESEEAMFEAVCAVAAVNMQWAETVAQEQAMSLEVPDRTFGTSAVSWLLSVYVTPQAREEEEGSEGQPSAMEPYARGGGLKAGMQPPAANGAAQQGKGKELKVSMRCPSCMCSACMLALSAPCLCMVEDTSQVRHLALAPY